MEQNMKMPDMYPKFFLMLGISFLIIYLVMFLNIAELEHFQLNVNRGYMALLMVSPMAMIMLLLMAHMYKDKKKNMVILIVSALSLWELWWHSGRNLVFQSPENDRSGLIPSQVR